MKKTEIFAFMLFISILLCACEGYSTIDQNPATAVENATAGGADTEQKEPSGQAAADEDVQTADADNTSDVSPAEDTEDAESIEAESLEEYALHLEAAKFSYAEINYEKEKMDGFSLYHSSGLLEQEPSIGGTVDWTIFDFDADGENELVTMDLVRQNSAWNLNTAVYEWKKGGVTCADTQTFVSDIFSPGFDSSSLRLFVKDDKYLCLDLEEYSFLDADGTALSMEAFSYNGESLIRMADYSLLGSDFSETGKKATELVDQLNTMGFPKTAVSVYDRNVFHFCMADDGIRMLSQLKITNSYLTTDKAHDSDPYAYFEYVEGCEEATAYIIPDSSKCELSSEELSGLTKEQLRIARNEIYARYGWSFKSDELDSYFRQKAWYRPYENITDDVLSEIEKKNQALIAEAEKTAPDKETLYSQRGGELSEEDKICLNRRATTAFYAPPTRTFGTSILASSFTSARESRRLMIRKKYEKPMRSRPAGKSLPICRSCARRTSSAFYPRRPATGLRI